MDKKKLRADIILALAILTVALSVFLIISLTRSEGTHVRVTLGGEEIALLSLAEDGEYSLNDGSNMLVIENGAASVRSADCPDGLCVRQRKISRSGERIVCLPNRIVIEVIGGEADTDLSVG